MTDAIQEMTFEDAIAELEAVVARLEGGEVPLDESIQLYKRGAVLRARCNELLSAAEEQVDVITRDAKGRATGSEPAGDL
ncbi:exodeoxyribonuclease VII small subunit [Jannaschia sp. Os4]|uniref:exodeoxyribonuclease VII small subunit n=1 Tax=Jannaschia sp. Os4 TaxID=2807617 RepID=UPI00193A2AF3|nr:exodeoxyribonuclease VII small subunit [Jannaschia sp. Os4]MBM2575406.1 exodeoxyribonuclease VII small subunit [Jannaschia sp. Os4]